MKILLIILPMTIGFILDCILGDPYSLPHPVRFIGKLISKLEIYFRRRIPENEKRSGTLLALTTVVISTLTAQIILIVCYRANVWLGAVVEGVMFYYLIAAKCLKTESMKVHEALKKKDIEGARKAVSMIVGRDTERLDESGIIKAAVETVAENTSDGVTSPMFYMMLGGASFGFMYKTVNTLDSMIGYKNERYLYFGSFAAKLDDILNYIPSRLTAVLMILSSCILKFDGRNALRIWRRDRRNHASPNSAQTESVCAGALDIMLAGDAYYFGKLYRKKTIGDDIRPIRRSDIVKANRLMYCTSLLMLALCMAVRLIILGVIKS